MNQTDNTKPVPLGLAPSFGFGDRLGCATPGHLDALREHNGPIRGIFAQQSIREMARTQRTPEQVMAAASDALHAAGYDQPWGADADHLKTPHDVDRTARAGFVFFTIDPSDHVDQQADNYAPDRIDSLYKAPPWAEQYLGKTIKLPSGSTIVFDELTVKRAAVKYGKAIQHAVEFAGYIRQATAKLNRPHEIEISVDETDQPTTPAEHYIIADQLVRAGVNLVSLAPRFIGDLEKGIDYIGDINKLERSLRQHAEIADALGPYKLSLHSGSDKLAMYPAFAKATKGRFHVKTAGTSYLEALRVAVRHAPDLFRRIIEFSRSRYDTDRATYHVHATLRDTPPPDTVRDTTELESIYLQRWEDVPPGQGFTAPGRQVLHCTFGSVLTHDTLSKELAQVLAENAPTYRAILCDHFARHLAALWPD
ncbi:MAG: tagaturonate epimerase family protein [Phycisphaerales bacterium]